jgi:phosphoglycolate phosphatase-like HAD superfamily hydrolase
LVYIGDTVHDYMAAKEAGVPFVHILSGFGEKIAGIKSFNTFEDLINATIQLKIK